MMSKQVERMESLMAALTAGEEAKGQMLVSFGKRIVQMRLAKGWGRAELARHLGVSRERLGNWERGENTPPLWTLVALARALGVTLDELIAGERAAA